jgi:GNAT superfamily N-acetyltransferase
MVCTEGISLITDIRAALAEGSEAEALYDFETGAPAAVRSSLGITAVRLGGGVVLSVREDPTDFWSKALGFGFEEPVTADLVREICDFYREQGTSAANVQIISPALPDDWPDICAREHLTAGSATVKLVCDTDVAIARAEEGARLPENVRVGLVEEDQAAEWASVMGQVFGMPDQRIADLCASTVGRPGWYTYAVWDGTELAATGIMCAHKDTAQYFGGATLPHARRRGFQSALITARAQAAKAAGCRWLVTETGAEEPGEHNSSLHNLLRTGFSVLHERRTWIWRAAGSTH